MNARILRRVRQMFNSPYVSVSTNRANQLKWVRAVRSLGPKWVYWETRRLA